LRAGRPRASRPWVEKDTIKPDTTKQQVRFAVKKKEDFDLEAVKKAFSEKTSFTVGKVLEGPGAAS
jgi:hypothetical protein